MERLGASWEALGRFLKRLRFVLGVSWGVLGAPWEAIGASWEALGSFLESTWEIFGAQKALAKHLGSDDVKF